MNCEMAQRTIALAALAPTQARHAPAARPLREAEAASREGEDAELAQIEADFFAEHPELAPLSVTPPQASAPLHEDLPEPELSAAERKALEEHLAVCRECQAEMAATAAFYRALSLTRQPEPTPSLLARARLRLDATLDHNAHQSALAHLLQQLSFSAGRLQASPGLASALLLVGLAMGGYCGYRTGRAVHNTELLRLAPVVAHVSSIVRQPDSEQVEVNYDRLVPDTASGSLDDPSIRRLLVLAMDNGANPSVRNDSIGLLAHECRHGHQCNGGPIRVALVNALRKDHDPRVRLEALDGLEPYIAEDQQVRDSVLHAMMADASPDVRIEAIRLLTPVEVDSSVRHALRTLAVEDHDPTIRNASQQMLNGMPQVQ